MPDCIAPLTTDAPETTADRILLLGHAQEEAQRRTGWKPSIRSFQRWADQGIIELVRVGGKLGVYEGELRRFLARKRPRQVAA